MAILTLARPFRWTEPAAGEAILKRGTGRTSRSASLSEVPGAWRTASSAEARTIAFSTISGRARCCRSDRRDVVGVCSDPC